MKEQMVFCEKCGQHFTVKEKDGLEIVRKTKGEMLFIHMEHSCPSCKKHNTVLWLHWLDGRGKK